MFQLKEKVLGQKKSSQECTSIRNPDGGNIITDRKEILKATLKYCKDLLTNSEPSKDFEDDFKTKLMVHAKRMKEREEEYEMCLTYDMYQDTLEELAKKKGEKYEFILKSGPSLKNAIYKLFVSVWKTERKPEEWRKTSIIQIPKGKTESGNLNNMRNIHLKEPIPKMFGHIIMNQVKEKLMKNMTKYQLGTKTGHRPQEHIFVIKSMIAMNQKYKKGMIINLYDISKFFDRENLPDVLGEAYPAGLKGKYYRLMHELNKDTIIKVKTAIGETKEVEVGAGLGQGGVESAVLSALSLSKGVQLYFSDSTCDMHYGNVPLKAIMWQDDLMKPLYTLKEAQDCNWRMEAVLDSKLLSFNLSK